MVNKILRTSRGSMVILLSLLTFVGPGQASEEAPSEFIFKFVIRGLVNTDATTGAVLQPPTFTINGPGFAPIVRFSGEILDYKSRFLKRATLRGAQIQFELAQAGDPAYVSRFTCLTDDGEGCRIEFNDGSVLVADADIQLDGRLITGIIPPAAPDAMPTDSPWGFVPNNSFDPATGVLPQRILGCGGLRGHDTEGGRFAGMVGSICFNGTFNVPTNNQGIDFSRPLTGGSNCTITMHHPAKLINP